MRCWLRGVAVVGVAGLVAGLLSVVGVVVLATPAVAASDAGCTALGGTDGAGTCFVNATVSVSGSIVVNENLVLQSSAHLDATGTGVSLTVTGNMTMEPGAVFEADDPCCFPNGNASASGITLSVSGDLLMKAQSEITADNNVQGGNGGNVSVTVGGNMTMCGVSASPAACTPTGSPGALISSVHEGGAGDTGVGGIITITVGSLANIQGDFFMGGGSTGYLTETGAKITTSSNGPSGDINVTAGHSYHTEPGSVVEAGNGVGTTLEQGGKIYIVSGCDTTSLGRVTSKGQDPGADLVHLEGCNVLIGGLVESTGKAHTTNAPNSCDNVNDGLPGEVFRDKPAESTACIEVFGKIVTIDATNGLAGELNADIGDGGSGGRSWIDVFACCSLTIKDGTGNDRSTNNGGGAYTTTFAVHANSLAGSDVTPNAVTVLSKGPSTAFKPGTITGSGKILQAAQEQNGSAGGTIDVQAYGTVNFDASAVVAAGDNFGGPSTPCTDPGGSGTCGSGGHIKVQSWTANITWRNGAADVTPDNTGPNGAGGTTIGGTIDLTACTTIDTSGTNFNGETPSVTTGTCDPSKPDVPAYAFANSAVWDHCGQGSIAGRKTNADTNAGIDGWTINLHGPVETSTTTSGGGFYSFTNLPQGVYTVCEVLPDATWTEVTPSSGASCTGTGEAAFGYTADLTAGGCCTPTNVTGDNFSNRQRQSPPTKSGYKFNDLNGNGTWDNPNLPGGEPGLNGWTINLWNAGQTGVPLQTTTTANDGTGNPGFYIFTLDPNTTYVVCEVPQAGWTQTAPAALGGNVVACTHEGTRGYTVGPLANGTNETNNNFGNQQLVCNKPTAINRMNTLYPNNAGPDTWVRVYAPFNESVQTAVDNATDTNGDNYIIVFVIAHSDGSLGGSANQSVVVNKDYGEAKPFALFGCSVTLTGGGNGPAVSVAATANSKNWPAIGNRDIFVMDLHGGSSGVGVQVDSSAGLTRWIDNEAGDNNGIGIKVIGNGNYVHNGEAVGNSGDGVQVNGNTNTLDTTDAYSNGGNGFTIAGNGNILQMRKAGDTNKGNVGVGVYVNGTGNQLTQIVAIYNGVAGFQITGATTAASANVFVKNNTGQNQPVDFKLNGFVKNTSGGNKADGVEVPKTTSPTKCVGTFPVKAAAAASFTNTSCT